MKNKIWSRYGLLLLLGVCACEVVDQKPVSDFTQESYWTNREAADAGAVAMYDRLQLALGSDNSNVVNFGDARTDMFVLGSGGATNANSQGLVLNQLLASNDFASWDEFYKTILRANLVLKYVPGIADPRLDELRDQRVVREQYLGEAYFVRALCYFYLVRLWGEVPLHTEPFTSPADDFKVARTPAAQVLDLVEADLAEALTRVPNSTANDRRVRATVGAVQSLLTDVYLWRGKHQEAADMALAVINTSGYSLAPSFNALFPEFDARNRTQSNAINPVRNSPEIIFQLVFDNLQLENNFIARLFLYANEGGSHRYAPSPKLAAAYEAGDRRALSTLSGDQIVKFRGTGQPGDVNRRFSDNNIIVYRLADVILMRAEALARLGRTAEAVQEYNKVRSRAFVPPVAPAEPLPKPTEPVTAASSSEEMLNAILDERFRELAGEGKRWFDLVRNNRALTTPGISGLTDAYELLWPVADDEIRLYNDPSFQNPGY